jgi:hypothetical protein
LIFESGETPGGGWRTVDIDVVASRWRAAKSPAKGSRLETKPELVKGDIFFS